MACPLRKEQIEKLYKKVTSDLLNQANKNIPFDIKSYSKGIYSVVYNQTKSHSLAINYVQMIPISIIEAQSRSKEIRTLIKNAYPEIVDLEDTFKNFDKTIEYLDLNKDIIDQIKSIQEIANKTPDTIIPKEIKDKSLEQQREKAKPNQPLTTTGQEAIITIDSETGVKTWTSTPDPTKKLYYNTLRSILDKLYTPLVNGDSSKLDIPGTRQGGVYLTAMSASKIPIDQVYEETKAWLNEPGISEEEKQTRLHKHNKLGVVLTLTDIEGNPISFNEVGEVSYDQSAKPSYYMMRATDDKGTLTDPKSIQTPEQAAKSLSKILNREVTATEAKKIQDDQTEQIHKIREYIKKDPENNTIRSTITGGSKGLVQENRKAPQAFSKLLFEIEHPFQPIFQEDNTGPFYKTAVYFYYPGIETPIHLQRRQFTAELATKVSSLLVNDITAKAPSGEDVSLSPYEKLNYAKNYIQTTDKGMNIQVSEDGQNLEITIKGVPLDLSDKDLANKTIIDYLTRISPSEIVTRPTGKIIDGTQPEWEKELYQGAIVKTVDTNGKDIYTKWVGAQININRKFLSRMEDFQDFTLSIEGENTRLIPTDKNYKDFLGEHTVINIPINEQGKIVTLNGYFNYSPLDSEIEKLNPKETIEVKPEVTPAKIVESSVADQRQKDIDDLLATLEKTTGQKEINKKATEEQITEARSWYNSSPLSKHFPFEVMFNMINAANPNAVATWTVNGITLYKGADYSDLYHEAWHAFTQGFLTKDQKQEVYNELRNKSGKFTTYQGKNISFKSASNIELEEYLAEDFRNYMLSDGKKLTTPVRNTLFRKILNFLKALFGNSTVAQLAINQNAISTINDLYEKLRIGDLHEFTFSGDNINFNILNKGLEAISSEEPLQSLSYEDSRLLVDTIDSLFSELIDLKNTKDLTNRFTSTIVTSSNNRSTAYKYSRTRLAHIRNDLQSSLDQTTDQFLKEQIQKNINLLDYAIRNFGDPEKPIGVENGKGLINYHNLKSKYLSLEDKFEDVAPEENEDASKGREGYNKNGNETSLTDLASNQVLYLIRSLNAIDNSGNTKKNKLGVNQLAEFDVVWNRLAKVLEGSSSPEVMEKRLKSEAETFPVFKQLLSKLGSSDTISGPEFKMWTDFWNAFNKTRIPLIQMTLDKVTNEDGTSTYISKIGQSSTDYKKAGQAWDNLFQITYANPYIKKDTNNINYLDIPTILKDFPANTIKENAFKFFKAIGVQLSDKKEIKQGIANDIGKANIIRAVLANIQSRGLTITKVSDVFKLQQPAMGNIQELRGEAGNWKRLMELETRYSDQYSNFSVTNAEGNAQFEHSLNSTLTQMINTINSVKSFDELIALPHMNHLDTERNPYTKSSIWITSLFDMNSPGRPKRKDAKLNLENLSGVQLTIDNEEGTGIASASADEFTKFLMDFHMMIMRGTPELMRAADKGTSLMINLNKLLAPGNKSGKLYIDTEEIIANKTKAIQNLTNIVINYVGSELSRINTMENASELNPIRNVSDYYNRGKEFVLFDDVLSSETKSKLKKLDLPLDTYLKNNTPRAIELRKDLETDITKYFNSLVKSTNDRYTKTKFVANNLITSIKEEANNTNYKAQVLKASSADIVQGALTSFVINQWIHNVETMNFLYGDIALYNMGKEEFHKRNAGAISTGTIYRSDESALRYLNEVIGFGYANSKGIAQDPFQSILNSAVLEDTHTLSVYHDQYKKAIESEIKDRYSKRKDFISGKISKEDLDKEISKAIESALKPYTEMNTGDAQGWITFDSYRAVKTLDNSWTPKQEELYQKIIKGESTRPSEVSRFFPVQKLQYFGPLHTEGLPTIGFHKFSVFPLIPSVIKGTNLEKLHDKLVTENVHYALFKSGSKVSTITKQGVTDPFYSNEQAKVISQEKLTKNPIFIEYLKNQLETASTFKESSIFPTQLRKLIEDGLYENGKPVNDKVEKLVKNYEDNIRKLTEVKKKELLREAGWILDKNGNPKGDLKPLLKFVRKELTRQDLADHQIDFIDIKGNTNQIKHDLSISLSADKIERLLTAIVNKRLIRQKVNGEALIQVSGAGFENLSAFDTNRNLTNPTEGDLKKWGSNDLPTYHQGPDGKTRAMKVKIAMQGQFEKLLQLDEVRDRAYSKSISTTEALNELLKDEPWLNTGTNRQMITMIGVRIPVQGLNSMEFMEIYEFLPKEAGNIIVPPDEIVAKSGSDFDIDKLTVMMPNFRKNEDGKITLTTQYSQKQARTIYEKVKAKRIALEELKDDKGNIIWTNDAIVDKFLTDVFGDLWSRDYTHEELEEILKPYNLHTFEDFYETLNGSKAVENDLLQNMREILELPQNFTNLVRPNNTDIVKPVADILQDQVQDYNPKSRVHPGNESQVSGTRVLEQEYNLYKHQSNNVGKQTLGLGAVDNSYNVVFNRIGAHLNPSYEKKMPNGKLQERPLNIYLPHNTIDVSGKPAISLGNILDSNGQYRISDVISQLINGWVDVAKDAWIFNIQGNKEVAPVLLFLIQAGVPFEHAVYFVSQPLVREYVTQQRLAKSTFADPLDKAPFHPNFYRRKAKETVLLDPRFDFNLTQSMLRGKAMDQNIYNLTREMTSKYKDSAFDFNTLKNNIGAYSAQTKIGADHIVTEEEQAAFLHYLELEDMSRSIRDIKLRMNFDTKRSTTLFEAHNRQLQVEQLKADGKIPTSIVNNILTNSPIGSFNIQEFMINLWNPLFNLRNNKVVENFIVNKFREGISDDVENTFDDPEKFVSEFKNDLVSFIFQNSVKAFNLNNIKEYKGFNVDTSIPVESVKSLKNGVFVKNNVIYVDKAQLQKDFSTKAWSGISNLKDHITEYDPKTGLAVVNVNAFSTSKEYQSFVFEREYLRSMYTSDKVKTNADYIKLLSTNITDKKITKLIDETHEEFEKRLKKISYEQFLRNQALDNTFNSWKMFYSDTSYADEYNSIIDTHPDLKNEYLLFRVLATSIAKQGIRNLYSLDSNLDGDKLNTLHENILNLSNVSVIKSTDPVENERISNFFKRFPVYAFMQSGLSAKGKYALTSFVPVDMFTRIMEEPVKVYSENMNNVLLDLFYKKFILLNTSKNSFRHKNYVVQQTLGQTVGEAKVRSAQETIPTVPITETGVEGIKEFHSLDYSEKSMINMIASNPEAVFVYGRTLDATKKSSETTNGIMQKAQVGFTLGIPTKTSYAESKEKTPLTSVLNALTDQTLEENKKLIDVAIQQLLDFKSQGRDIVFDKNGYGQGMIGRSGRGTLIEIPGKVVPKPGQQTFLYLSEQLYEKFRYINNNFLLNPKGRQLVQRDQPVTDEEVTEFMSRCIGF